MGSGLWAGAGQTQPIPLIFHIGLSKGGVMDATKTAQKPHNEAIGMAVAGAVATAIAAVVIPVTLVVAAIVHSQEIVPRMVQAVAQRLPKRGAR